VYPEKKTDEKSCEIVPVTFSFVIIIKSSLADSNARPMSERQLKDMSKEVISGKLLEQVERWLT
jgi:hypothetical protein